MGGIFEECRGRRLNIMRANWRWQCSSIDHVLKVESDRQSRICTLTGGRGVVLRRQRAYVATAIVMACEWIYCSPGSVFYGSGRCEEADLRNAGSQLERQ